MESWRIKFYMWRFNMLRIERDQYINDLPKQRFYNICDNMMNHPELVNPYYRLIRRKLSRITDKLYELTKYG